MYVCISIYISIYITHKDRECAIQIDGEVDFLSVDLNAYVCIYIYIYIYAYRYI